jgi:DNA-binding NarL/FixJ family response regulator
VKIVIFDRQPVYAAGLRTSLQQHVSGIDVSIVNEPDDLWRQLLQHPDSLLILDGGVEPGFCEWLLREKRQQFPVSKTAIVVREYSRGQMRHLMDYNFQALVLRDASVEVFVQAIKSVALGVTCLPGDWLVGPEPLACHVGSLSHRQKDVAELLGAGCSNREIGDKLGICIGTVKFHVESIYRRLGVNNRTQAALLLNKVVNVR